METANDLAIWLVAGGGLVLLAAPLLAGSRIAPLGLPLLLLVTAALVNGALAAGWFHNPGLVAGLFVAEALGALWMCRASHSTS